MCGRYYFSVDLLDEIRELVEPGDWKLELGLLEKDMHPGDVAPVITIRDHTAQGYAERGSVEWGSAERGNVERGNVSPAPVFLGIQKMRWGFKAPGGKGLVFNARSESVLEKRMFRDSVSHRRVAVPVSWFYEWNQSKEKYTFTREDGQVLFLAGFYSKYEDGDHFVILTTQANQSMAPVHSRMPLVLERDQVRDWIMDEDGFRGMLEQVPARLSKSCEYEQQTLF
ncbi:SOS response-associated peptidase [Lachnoclostridium pacaense]|uniref:SOS response-associated peptidase n=1 Tax=Enterocloster hominis (ex Hitch et al. 2024) TaxID=1917870 RepID=UPI001D11F881|nr:SOS response-associated peptidase [Lachnoclostridium pacaense]MCC2875270.1 SOS response-associated peptidase [Lachnoclostridium pacaense]